jgi:enoyl-CoA hydratase
VLTVAREQGDLVAIWTVDRPATKNALDFPTMEALLDEARRAVADRSLRAVVLMGSGKSFVSGGDLRELRERSSAADAERLSDLGWALTTALEELPVPVIAALTGPAIGGGAELAIACDLRVAEEGARLSFKQVRMGVTTAWGSVPRLAALVGAGAAARLLYTAGELTAAEAKLAGLVDEVVPDGEARSSALAWATEIAAASPSAVAKMKELLRRTVLARPDVRDAERRAFVETWSGDDHREAMAAWFERRPPVWTARQ